MTEKRGHKTKMKKFKIKIPKENKPSIMKETPETRKERIKYAPTMRTQVVPNKKYKTRAQQKQTDYAEIIIETLEKKKNNLLK